MVYRKKIFLLLILSFSSICFFGQEYNTTIRHLTAEDGLSSDITKDICFDSRGNIWVATNRGMDIYDGNKFTQILSGRFYHYVFEDDSKRMWFIKLQAGKDKGRVTIEIYDLDSNSIKPLSEYSFGKDIQNLGDLNSVELYNNLVWLRTAKDELFYLKNDNLFTFDVSQALLDKSNCFYPRNNNTWIFNHIPPYFQNISNGFFAPSNLNGTQFLKDTFFADKIDPWELVSNNERIAFHAIQITKKNDERFNAYELKPKDGSLRSLGAIPIKASLNRNSKYSFDYLRTSDLIWWRIMNQIKCFNNEGELIFDSATEQTNKIVFQKMVSDPQGNIWAVSNLGIYLINIKKTPFKRLLTNKSIRYSCRGMVLVNDSTLFLNSYAGCRLVDINNDTIIKKFHKDIKGDRAGVLKSQNKIYAFGSGILEYNLDNNLSVEQTTHTLESKSKINITVPYREQNSDIIWLGGYFSTSYLIKRYINDSKTTIEELEFDLHPQPIHTNTFFEDEEGLWIGAENGLFLIDPKSKKKIADRMFTNISITHIQKDEDQVLWLTTSGSGLIRFDFNTGETKTYGLEHGFLNLFLKAVYEDSYGNLWIPTERGLARFNKETELAKIFLLEDGISHYEYNTFSHYRAEDGRLFFGGIDGITVFHPDSLYSSDGNNNIQPIQGDLSMVKLFDTKKGQYIDVTTEVKKQNGISLSPKYSTFRLEYNYLDYLSGENITYAYQVNGHDNQWHYQNSSLFQIGNIPYGKYTLMIKAKGADAKWSEIYSIPLQFVKPYYLNPLFLMSLILLLGAAVWFFIHHRTARLQRRAEKLSLEVLNSTQIIREQNKKLEKANLFKNKILAIASHDLRAPLITMSNLADKVNFLIKKNRTDDITKLSEQIDHSADNVSILLNNLFNWTMIQNGDFIVEPTQVELKPVVNSIIELYQDTAKLKSITFINEIAISSKVITDKNAIELILRNLISNAVKFTLQKGTITIRATNNESAHILEVNDGGIGIKKENLKSIFEFDRSAPGIGTSGEKGTGFGLMISKEFAELINADIYAESEYGNGASFFISLPYSTIS